MGVKYAQIADMIEKGTIEDSKAKEIILNRFRASKHKREKIPTYKFDRINCLLESE